MPDRYGCANCHGDGCELCRPRRRRTVAQAPTATMPPPELMATPRPPFRTTEERVAWLQRTYADYPDYLALFIAGGVDFK